MKRYFLSLIAICLILLNGCYEKKDFWNKSKLDEAIQYSKEIGTFSMIIQTDGEIVASVGDLDSLSRTHSIRKAILMAILSQHFDKIDLESTLADLNIDDSPIPLTELQKTAKVIHLVKSISGINHPAVSQVGNAQMIRDSLLGRNSNNEPGTLWAYNNWDYNALTTIVEQEIGSTLPEAFEEGIAAPPWNKTVWFTLQAGFHFIHSSKNRFSTIDKGHGKIWSVVS
jgi:hypothetical protein